MASCRALLRQPRKRYFDLDHVPCWRAAGELPVAVFGLGRSSLRHQNNMRWESTCLIRLVCVWWVRGNRRLGDRFIGPADGLLEQEI